MLLDYRGSVKLKSLIEHCVQEAALADAEMQLLQRSAWRSLNKGAPLLEGTDHLEFLGVREMTLAFNLILIKPPWWRRLIGRVFKIGRPLSPRFRLLRVGEGRDSAIPFTLKISRDPSGRTRITTEPPFDHLGDSDGVGTPAG
jgi:hypothetical protein